MRVLPPIAALALLAACAAAAVPVYLKPGVPAAEALRDEAACRVAARAQVPERPRVTVAPSIGIGVGRCTGGACIGVTTATGTPYDYDTNADLRGQAVGTCMGAKGYRLITLPACTGAARPLATHPFDTRGLCVANGAIASPV